MRDFQFALRVESSKQKMNSPRLRAVTQLPSADQAIERVAQSISSQGGQFTDDGPNPLVRQIISRARNPKPLNVVLVVMESFTGRVDRMLGGVPALSPELDVLAAEGLLFERCYATGERTIQGLEAAVCSFPPLPGEGW